MFTPGTVNTATIAMPMMPPPNYCAPPVYGNIPYHPPFVPPFYPPCNYYNNPPPFNCPNSSGDGSSIPADFSKPPPGYATNGCFLPQNSCNSNPVPAHQYVHMANVRSTNFAGYPASNASPIGIGNQFSRPPPAASPVNRGSTNNTNRFSNPGNHRRNLESREWPYYCESCDRGFSSLAKFKQHKSEHKTCEVEGCTFSGHEKIVEKHFMMQHSKPGLFNRIVRGYSPEEIQKWISERKKLFPTKEKIEVKEAQREEMKKRGERYAEQRGKFNQRNSNFKHGPGNRFNRNVLNKNGQFRNRLYGHRRNSFVCRTTDENDQPQRKKVPVVLLDEDCELRNVCAFGGKASHQPQEKNSQNEEEHEEHTITDNDDDCSVWSEDDDVEVIDSNHITVEKKVIYELEKSSEISQQENNSEEDCLDKYFKNCDDLNENEEDDCDVSDKNSEKFVHSDMRYQEKQNDTPVNDPVIMNSAIGDKPALKAMSSLALLQSYVSDDDTNDDEDDVTEENNVKTNSLSNKISEKNEGEGDKPVELPFKCISDGDENSEIESDKFETERNYHSSDDSGPDEAPSKIKVLVNDDLNRNVELVASSPTSIDETKTNTSPKSEEDEEETRVCESKKRKRKRHKDGKTEIDCDEKSDKKSIPEVKLPRVFHPRKRYKPPTLLERLLHCEIKHERNVILQCIRYTVVNNFFGVEDKN